MTCKQLSAFLKRPRRDRPPPDLHDALRHAAQCPKCNERLILSMRVEEELSQLSDAEASGEFAGKVMERIAREAQPAAVGVTRPRAEGWPWVAVLLCSAVLLAVGYFLGTQATGWVPRLVPESAGIGIGLIRRMFDLPPSAVAFSALGASLVVAALLWKPPAKRVSAAEYLA